jgi:hypothetical protein
LRSLPGKGKPGKGKKRGKGVVAKIIKRVQARYEIEDVEFGKIYRWRPESLVDKCDCGEEQSLTASKNACPECGTNYRDILEEVLDERLEEDKLDHPWRYPRPWASSGMSEHDEHPHRASSPEHSGRCKHRLIDIEPIVSVRVEGGYKARCLLCGKLGSTRSNSEAARRVLLDQSVGSKEKIVLAESPLLLASSRKGLAFSATELPVLGLLGNQQAMGHKEGWEY